MRLGQHLMLQVGLTSGVSDPAHLHQWQIGLSKSLGATGQAKEGMILLQQALGQQDMPQATTASMLRLLVELQVSCYCHNNLVCSLFKVGAELSAAAESDSTARCCLSAVQLALRAF